MTAAADRGLRWVRAVCLSVSALAVALFALGLPVHYRQLQTICAAPPCYAALTPEAAQALDALGLSVGQAAAFQVGVIAYGALVNVAVALAIFLRRPADRMAWFTGLTFVTFATFGVHEGASVRGVLAAVHPFWSVPVLILQMVGAACINMFFFLFPDGRVAPRWLRWPLLALIAWQGPIVVFPGAWLDPIAWPPLANLLYWSLFFGALMSVQVYRYRRVSTPVQRQQTKWAVFGFGLALGGGLAAYVFTLLLPRLDPRWAPLSLVQTTSYYLFLPFLPLFIGFAVLRYRLFDIDVLIRRTLVYSILTGLLALVYFSSIIALQTLLRGVTGSDSPIAIVLSTLVIAALFVPVRARVQRAIDRRFYRRKYDAARTLAAFGAQARDETNLSRLSERLQGAVQDTMEPAHVGLWLKDNQPA